ncbi:MAG: hypothetical protein ACI4T2_01570 [Christensenellales bacterium]
MKKLKTLFACLILLCSCMIFASCQSGAQKVEFGETSPVVMEVGETYSPSVFVTPEKYLEELTLSTSDARVVVISPDNKLVAVGTGSAQIEARVGNATANLVVEVVEKRQKLQTPVGFHYEAQANRIVWSEVKDASSYDVEIGGEIVAKNLTTNFYEISPNGEVQRVRIKANGINRFSDSDFTQIYEFRNLQSPTNLSFDKATQTLSWQYPQSDAKFKVCVNKVLLDVINSKSFVLNLSEKGVYDVCVIAVAQVQNEGDVLVFDSLRSESIEISRLGGVDKNSIVWNASENLLTWGEVSGAKYEVSIDGQTPVLAEKNNIQITDLEKGIHEITITAISSENLVLNANEVATSNVAITKQLPTPQISRYDADTNKLTLLNVGDAQNFEIVCNGHIIYEGPAEIDDGTAIITLPSDIFENSGEYELVAKSKADEARFFTESNSSEQYLITRLSAPTYLNIENGKTFTFASLPQANFGYSIFVDGAEHEISETRYEVFDLAPGTYEIKVKYLGNKNTILESHYSTMTVAKLSTPVLEFDKSTLRLAINKETDVVRGYDITINGSLQKNVQQKEYSLAGMLATRNNEITVQALPNGNDEILSNVSSIDIYKLEEIANLEHETISDISSIKFDTNANYDNYVITLGSSTNLDYTIENDGDKTILKLKDLTSSIFENAGGYTIFVEALSTNKNVISAPSAQIRIEKLAEPTGLTFEFPNEISWDKFAELENNFELVITKDGTQVYSQTTTENELSIEDLTLGTLKAKVKVLGNRKDVLDSNYCAEIEFVHEKLSKPQNVEYSNDLIIWSEVAGADCYEISIGSQKFESDTNSFVTANLSVGQYQATIKAKNTKDSTITSDYSEIQFAITRKLAAPTNLSFDKSTRTLTFDGVETAENGAPALATKYMVYVNDVAASAEYTNKTSFTFNSDAFLSAGIYELKVQAFGEGIYTNISSKSEPLTVEKLAAPISISITDEIVSCAYNSEIVDHVEILINGTEGNNLADLSGEIDVKARYIGKTDELIDSEYYETTIYRLGKITNFKLNNDVISWSGVANASGYVISVKPENENLEKFYLDSDVSSFVYEFRYEGSYSIEIFAQGGEVEGKQYLDSAHETMIATKNVAPTNVALVEDTENGLITITYDYAGQENSASKFGVYVDGVLLGETSTNVFQCESVVFAAVKIYEVQVKAVGNNANNYVSSALSSSFITERLLSPLDDSNTRWLDGYYFTFTWNNVSPNNTAYQINIKQYINNEETAEVKSEYVEPSSSNLLFVSFYEEMQTNQFVEGEIRIFAYAIGDNSRFLGTSRDVCLPFTFSSQPTVSHDADKLLITRSKGCYVSVEYFITNENGEESEHINTSYQMIDSIIVNEILNDPNFSSGEITFVIRQWKGGGEMPSAPLTYKIKRFKDTTSCEFFRDETDSDIIYLKWEPVEGASGYLVAIGDDNGETKQIYSGIDCQFALPLSEMYNLRNYFYIKTLGSSETGFSSVGRVKASKLKLVANQLNFKNENGVISWEDGPIGNIRSFSSGFKLVITDENGRTPYTLDNNTYNHLLPGHSGQLNLKLKRVGDLIAGLDSDYAELNIVKLPKPTNIRVVEGQIKWDFGFTLGEGQTINFVYKIDGMEFDATTEGIANLTATLLAGKEYRASVQAKNNEIFLSSDNSDEIVVKVLENPNANDNTTYISTNLDKTISWFNWSSALGAAKYEVKVEGGELENPVLNVITDTKWTISGLDAGAYSIFVRRIGGTGMVDGVGYLSSGFSTPISFTVLAAPEVTVSNGEIAWLSQDGANNYYIYIGDSYKPCGNVTYWTFAGEYNNFTKETNINLFMQAIGDGTSFIASAKTSEIKVVKPRPPQMLVVKDGALCWANLEDYTYFEDTENKNIYLDFIQNGTTAESFEIDVNNLKNGWPLDDNYLQKLTSNLPAGSYTLKIKQIGDSKKVITSEYSEQTLDVIVAPNPTNVFIDEHNLQWDSVTLENYSETNEVVYVVYAFDSIANDWIKLAETNTTFLDVENTSGLLMPQHIALAVAVKGNTTQSGYNNYITGNMSEKIDIIVLGSTSDIQTVDGNLTWGIVANAVNYRIESSTNNMVVEGGVQSSYLKGFNPGVHNIRIRALGNGTTKFGSCIINGVWGDSLTFTKLDKPVASTKTDSENKSQWGAFHWGAIENSFGYNIFVNNELYNYIEGETYESDYPGSDINVYAFQAKGNSATPSESNVAYISSDLSDGLARARMTKINGVRVINGKLYWLPSNSGTNTKYYFVEFYQNQERVARVPVEVNDKNLVKVNGVSMVEFDVAGFVTQGTYTVLVREVSNSDIYIAGVESDPIEISKLDAPSNVHLDNGILTWNNVEGATGYILRIVSDTNTIEYSEGFSFDEERYAWRWVSELETGIYRVSIRAVSTDENKLSSSWATKYGEMEGELSTWEVRQIPKIILGNINVNDEGNIVWTFSSSSANIPANKAYIVWRKGEASYVETPILDNFYPVDENLMGIAIRTIPYGENEFDYFASIFSEIKDVDRPEPPQDLTYDSTKQIFTWTAAGTSDASYIVFYSIDDGEEKSFETEENKFAPTQLGNYKVSVKVKKSDSAIGTSEKSEEVEGIFNLFTGGDGTSSNPFLVNSTNFENIMHRPNSYFQLTENIVRNNKVPLGGNRTNSPNQFLGKLDGNNMTITVSFEENQNSIWTGIFAELGDGGQIRNLNVEVVGDFNLNMASSTSIHAGAIAGCVNGAEALIENCRVSGTTTITRNRDNETRFGGIVGLLKQGSIKNCISELNITSSTNYISKVGGIVGMVGTDSSINAVVDGCQNLGTITGANIVGGIAAYNYGTIKNSTNSANIQSDAFFYIDITSNEVICNSTVGGIVGENYGTKTNDIVEGGIIQNCENTGNVVASNTSGEKKPSSFAGGIVGETTHGLIDENKSRGQVLIESENSSSTTAAQAIVANFISYSEVSTNYKLSSLSQIVPSNMNMTIIDL